MLDALEASELRMRAFLADASHDLRTPVAGVIATADALLRDDPDRAERERRLVAMVREARRAGRLVDDLLLMARLDGVDPAAALRRQPVDLAVLAEEVAATQQLLGADVRAETEPAPVEGDPEQLARVLTNLADNARRAGGRVLIAVRREGGQAVVEVTDDGPGVPPAERDRVFERFVRLRGRPRRATGSACRSPGPSPAPTGGELTCENAPAGARFVLRVPAGRKGPGREHRLTAPPLG